MTGLMDVTAEEQEAFADAGLARICADKGPPQNWLEKIDRPILIGSDRQCMLGQIYGSYHAGRRALGIVDDAAAQRLGFFCNDPRVEEPHMNRIWMRKLTELHVDLAVAKAA